jgi:16S rRNA (uracil1498-N3)-methyltransferase
MELYYLSEGELSLRRFFVPPEAFGDGSVTISGDLFRHMVKVLRLKPGAGVLLADGRGTESAGIIDSVGKETLIVTIQESFVAAPVAAVPRITLFQGLPKGDKLEFILQKTTELGVAEVIPFIAARSVPRIRKGEEAEKVVRWQRIVQEAARQSGRSSVPQVSLAGSMAEVVNMSGHSVKFLLWEGEKVNRLKDTLAELPKPENIALIVGPEGGLSAEEAATATAGGFIPVSLGPRIVRTETAGLVMMAILQFYWGDIG